MVPAFDDSRPTCSRCIDQLEIGYAGVGGPELRAVVALELAAAKGGPR